MRNRSAVVVAGLALALLPLSGAEALLAPTGNAADPPPGIDKAATVTPGVGYAWDGSTATGFNYYYWDPAGRGNVGPFTHTTCNKTAQFYCDQILIEYSNPLTEEEIAAGVTEKFGSSAVVLNTFTPTDGPVTDFDLLAYESDANGTLGTRITFDGDLQNTNQEQISLGITTYATQPSQWVLIRVVYYQVVNGSYKGSVTFG